MSSMGYVLVRVYASQMTIPIAGASVFITQLDAGGQERLLGTRVTDRSGKTELIEIPTPDAILSQEPNETNVAPFAVCNIWVSHENYHTAFIQNVQVFAENESIQNVEMIPLDAAHTRQNEVETVYITPQNL